MSVVWNVYQYFQNKTLKSDFNLAMKMCAAFHQGLWLFLKWPADKEEEDELVTICGPIIDHLDESGYKVARYIDPEAVNDKEGSE